jgi:hypothetical protein
LSPCAVCSLGLREALRSMHRACPVNNLGVEATREMPADFTTGERIRYLRRGRLYGEIAAGHLQRRELEQARHFLERSYTESPEEAPYSPLTRGVAVELVRTATGSLKAEAVVLVERMGILPAA